MPNEQTNVETVDLTPSAFLPSNPNAQQKIAECNKAMAQMEEALRAKADYLCYLVDEEFGGIENVCAALMLLVGADKIDRSLDETRKDIHDIKARYEALEKAHSDASEALMKSMQV